MRFLLVAGAVALCSAGLAQSVAGQTIQLPGNRISVSHALSEVSRQSGIDIVFSHDLVDGRFSTCSFEGRDVAAAITCVLAGTGVSFEQVAPRQYVLTAPEPADGYRLSGRVTDSSEGRGLLGAHVYLPDLRVGTVTREDGSFRIGGLARGRHQLRISYIGYGTVDTLVSVPSGRLTFALEPRSFGTSTLLVTGEAGDRADVAAIPGVVALPVSELLEIPTSLDDQDLFQALEWLPGIERTGETVGGLVVRGSGPDQNLYLLDGAPVYHPSHAFSLISTFQTETLSDVKFFRGSFPAEHGGMLSAVLDAELKDGRRTKPSTTVALNALSARFLVETPINSSSSFMLSARRSYFDKIVGRTHPVEENGRRDTLRTGYYFYDWSAKVSFRPANHSRLSITYYRGRDDLDLRLPFDLSLDFSSWLRPADLFFEVGHRWGNEIISARYQYVPSADMLLTLTAYESSFEGTESTFVRPTTSSVVVSDYEVSLRDLGAQLEMDVFPADQLSFRAGAGVVRHRFGSSLAASLSRSAGLVDDVDDGSDVESMEFVAFVQSTWKPSDRVRIQPGVRITTFEGAGSIRIDPRFSASYAITPAFILKLAAGTQVQHLHRLRDRYSFLYDLVSSRWVPVDDAVRPSVSGQTAFGVEYRLAKPLRILADVYYRTSDDVLVPRDELQFKEGLEGPGIGVSALLGQYARATTRSYGFEVTSEWQLRRWMAMLSYSSSFSESKSPEIGQGEFRPGRYHVPRSARAV
ncbi:MAG: TonB-dependent receptor, partial [Rhodothermales bacterium]|nr:TonB-dependent receptor [Rhodothermales bacterium]